MKKGRVSKTDAAWLAGFIDGEGCIKVQRSNINNGRVNYRIRVDVVNTNAAIITQIRDLVGVGAIYQIRSPSRCNPRWKPLWRWQTNSAKDARTVLELVRPYLRLKVPQADEMLALLSLPMRERGCRAKRLTPEEIADRDKHVLRISELNRRGPRKIVAG